MHTVILDYRSIIGIFPLALTPQIAVMYAIYSLRVYVSMKILLFETTIVVYMINLGLDIDNTITEQPEFFRFLSKCVREHGGKVYIVSSRTNDKEVLEGTKEDLEELGIVWDEIYLLPKMDVAKKNCPHGELNDSQKYNWQKVGYCKEMGIDVFFDDDDQVIFLFTRYAPEIKVSKICRASNVRSPFG